MHGPFQRVDLLQKLGLLRLILVHQPGEVVVGDTPGQGILIQPVEHPGHFIIAFPGLFQLALAAFRSAALRFVVHPDCQSNGLVPVLIGKLGVILNIGQNRIVQIIIENRYVPAGVLPLPAQDFGVGIVKYLLRY